jgi:hypothetical protein
MLGTGLSNMGATNGVVSRVATDESLVRVERERDVARILIARAPFEPQGRDSAAWPRVGRDSW